LRPMRPKPLIPTLIAIIFESPSKKPDGSSISWMQETATVRF
jgi:hypothetical protein